MKRCKFFYLCTTFLAIALTAVFLVLMFEPETSRAAGLWYVAPGGNNTNDCRVLAIPALRSTARWQNQPLSAVILFWWQLESIPVQVMK